MHVQSCCFANLNLLLFCRSRCRRRRRCLSSLVFKGQGPIDHHFRASDTWEANTTTNSPAMHLKTMLDLQENQENTFFTWFWEKSQIQGVRNQYQNLRVSYF